MDEGSGVEQCGGSGCSTVNCVARLVSTLSARCTGGSSGAVQAVREVGKAKKKKAASRPSKQESGRKKAFLDAFRRDSFLE